jgi:hypothetical protein
MIRQRVFVRLYTCTRDGTLQVDPQTKVLFGVEADAVGRSYIKKNLMCLCI